VSEESFSSRNHLFRKFPNLPPKPNAEQAHHRAQRLTASVIRRGSTAIKKRVSEALKAQILENAPLIVSFQDCEHNILWANRAYCEATGLTLEKLKGMKCYKAWGLKALCLNCPVTIALKTGKPAEAELTPQNQEKWPQFQGSWLSRAVPISDANSNLLGVIEAVFEITKYEEAEREKLEETEEKFRVIAESVLDAVILIDDRGKVVYWNPSAEKIFGYSAPEVMGKDVHEILMPLMPPEYWESFQRGFKLFQETGKGLATNKVLELTAQNKSGESVPVEIALAPIQIRGKYWASAIIREISERKRFEETLKRERELMQTLWDNIPVMITMYDSQGRMHFLNKEFERLIGWTMEEVREIDLMEAILPDPELRKKAWEFMLSATPQEWRVFNITTKNGRVLPSTWTHVRLSDGSQIGIGIDITELKRTQEALKRQRDILSALYAHVGKLTEKLDLKESAEEVVRGAVEILGVRLAWLGRAEKDGKVSLLAYYPPEITYAREISVRWDETPEGQGPTGKALRTGLPQIIEDVSRAPTYTPWREKALKEGFCTRAAFPLIARGETFGALNLYSDQPGFFSPERLGLIQAFAHLAATALENAQLFEETRVHLQRVTALRNIDIAILGSLDLRVTYRVILDEILTQLKIDAASILSFNPNTHFLEYAAGKGFRTNAIEKSRVPLGKGLAGLAAKDRRVWHTPDLSTVGPDLVHGDLWKKEGFVSYYAVPLIAKGKLLGVLEIFHRTPHKGNTQWINFLETLAGQLAIAIDSASLFNDLQTEHAELIEAYNKTIQGWAKALALKEEETEEHSQRVTKMTLKIARAMGIKEEQLIHVWRGALLHDIGKIGVPDSILLKAGPLTEEEWAIMRQHPVFAFEMLSPIEYLRPAIDIPYCHHEKWDGTGYPRGLKGEQIPLVARIFAVVDVWDALTSDRPYRKAWPEEKALEYIQEQSGKHFDPKVVDYFLRLIKE
jgi:PAS domain S-box-containing protein/putative nucleotidyltransferase with HDIG domain